jgi:hypothetical protein
MRRMVGLAVVVLLALLTSAYLYLDYIFDRFGECRIVRLTNVPSPDGSKLVLTYRKECGATVPYSTHAGITSAQSFSSPEIEPPFLSIRGTQDIFATWSGEQTVRIGLIPGAGTVYKRNQSAGVIRIEYE